MKLKMHQELPGDSLMAHDALDRNVGSKMKLRCEGRDEPYEAEIVAVSVDDDRRGYTLTLDLPDELQPLFSPEVPGVSWASAYESVDVEGATEAWQKLIGEVGP